MSKVAASGAGAGTRDKSKPPPRQSRDGEDGLLLFLDARGCRPRQLLTIRSRRPGTSASAASGSDKDGEGVDHTVNSGERAFNDVIEAVIAEEIEKRTFPEVAAHFRRCAQKLAEGIESLQKTNARLKTAKENSMEYKSNKIPMSQKAYTPSFETTLLDSTRLQEDCVVNFVVKKDTIFREATKVLHIFAFTSQKTWIS